MSLLSGSLLLDVMLTLELSSSASCPATGLDLVDIVNARSSFV